MRKKLSVRHEHQVSKLATFAIVRKETAALQIMLHGIHCPWMKESYNHTAGELLHYEFSSTDTETDGKDSSDEDDQESTIDSRNPRTVRRQLFKK